MLEARQPSRPSAPFSRPEKRMGSDRVAPEFALETPRSVFGRVCCHIAADHLVFMLDLPDPAAGNHFLRRTYERILTVMDEPNLSIDQVAMGLRIYNRRSCEDQDGIVMVEGVLFLISHNRLGV